MYTKSPAENSRLARRLKAWVAPALTIMVSLEQWREGGEGGEGKGRRSLRVNRIMVFLCKELGQSLNESSVTSLWSILKQQVGIRLLLQWRRRGGGLFGPVSLTSICRSSINQS